MCVRPQPPTASNGRVSLLPRTTLLNKLSISKYSCTSARCTRSAAEAAAVAEAAAAENDDKTSFTQRAHLSLQLAERAPPARRSLAIHLQRASPCKRPARPPSAAACSEKVLPLTCLRNSPLVGVGWAGGGGGGGGGGAERRRDTPPGRGGSAVAASRRSRLASTPIRRNPPPRVYARRPRGAAGPAQQRGRCGAANPSGSPLTAISHGSVQTLAPPAGRHSCGPWCATVVDPPRRASRGAHQTAREFGAET
jgi:hypothetical protein